MTKMERVLQYSLLMRFDKPIGIYLLMWPTLWALWIAGQGNPDGHILVVFILGVILMRASGCVINDYADRHIDGHVSRTRHRPIASGKITPREAKILFFVLCLLAFFLVLTTNTLTISLAFVAVILAAAYPFTKRYTYMPQAFLGLAFGWAVPMAFAAQSNDVPIIAWLLLIATVLWATAYDTIYAMVDREDDIRIGVKSTAILFGEADTVIIGMMQFLFIITLWVVGSKLGLGMFYYLGLFAAIGLAAYQQFLIKDRIPEQCFKAFLNNNWIGMVIFIGLVLHYFSLSLFQ